MVKISSTAREGDVRGVVYGAKVPYVLRPVPEKEGTYEFVGTAYVDGFMDGQAIQQRDAGIRKEELFVLV